VARGNDSGSRVKKSQFEVSNRRASELCDRLACTAGLGGESAFFVLFCVSIR
jgi:hypothetical protein